MDIFDAIMERVSIRSYDVKDVPEDFISQVLTAGTAAASAGDLQPWEFVVVRDRKLRKELSIAALHQKHVEAAPVVVVICADIQKSWLKFKERGKELYALQDSGAVAQNMLLAAYALGLGASWVRAFEEDALKTLLRLPDNLRPVGLVTLGFPLPYEKSSRANIIPYEEISSHDAYGQKLPWIKGYGRPSRYKIKTAYEYSKQLAERAAEKAEEKKVKETVTEKLKKFFGRFKRK